MISQSALAVRPAPPIYSGPVADIASLTLMRPFLILAPRLGDETLGCGGLIARGLMLGLNPTVIALTDGDQPGTPDYWGRPTSKCSVDADRFTKATAALGLPLHNVHRFGLASIFEADDSVVSRIMAIMMDIGACTIFVTDPSEIDSDRVAAFRLAVRLIKATPVDAVCGLVTYPIAQRFEGGDFSRFERLTVGIARPAKIEAIAQYGSLDGRATAEEPQFDGAAFASGDDAIELFRPIFGVSACPDPTLAALPELCGRAEHWDNHDRAPEYQRLAANSALDGQRFERIWDVASGLWGQSPRDCLPPGGNDTIGLASFTLTEAPSCALADKHGAPFDLIQLTDVLCHLGLEGIMQAASLCMDRLATGGRILVISSHAATETVMTASEAMETFAACLEPRICHIQRVDHPGFRLDLLGRQA
ncbi:hypothetical protein [Polymorphobacter sp.]|uniref:hypothetical protein n=1 Tax=Polymorphobacter sp. TaxID=1909290 RepID=UPI003F6E908F